MRIVWALAWIYQAHYTKNEVRNALREQDDVFASQPVAEHEPEDEQLEEADEQRVMKDPGQPSQKEWEEHRIDHWPFRSWCPHCVKGRATGKQHTKRQEECEIPVFGFDYLHTTEVPGMVEK